MSVLNQSGEEQVECPLCMEPLEVDDLHFYPCTCGYQICRFCWNRIREGENGLCPACRKAYPENPADFTPLSQEQVAAIKTEKKAREQKRRNKTLESRRALANVRVVQNNLVFVVGLPVRLADPEILKRQEYFGKYGKIHKVVINQSTTYAGSQGPSASAYVTYVSSADALRAIQGVNNVTLDGRVLKSSLGTTKYCANFMKNQPCPKPDCMYLHELGDPKASFTKDEMHQGLHQVYERKLHTQLAEQTQKEQMAREATVAEKSLTNSSGSSSTSTEKGSAKDGNLSNCISKVVTSSNINIVNSKSKNSGSPSASGSSSSSSSKEAWPSLGSSPPSAESPGRKQPSPKPVPLQTSVKSQENRTSENNSPIQKAQTKHNKENNSESSKIIRNNGTSNGNAKKSKTTDIQKAKQKPCNSINEGSEMDTLENKSKNSANVKINSAFETEAQQQQNYLSNELNELESDRHSLLENHDLLDNSDHSLLDDDSNHNLLNDANSDVMLMQRHREMLAGLVDNNHLMQQNIKNNTIANGFGILESRDIGYLGSERQVNQSNQGLIDQKEIILRERSRSEMMMRQNEILARYNVLVEPKHYMPSSIGHETTNDLLGANYHHQNQSLLPSLGMRSENPISAAPGFMLHNQLMQNSQNQMVNGYENPVHNIHGNEGRYLAENMDKFFTDFHKAQQMKILHSRNGGGSEAPLIPPEVASHGIEGQMGVQRRFQSDYGMTAPPDACYPHNMLSAERLELEQKHRHQDLNTLGVVRNAGNADDDLDFDPFKETQKALAEMMETEMQIGCSENIERLRRSRMPPPGFSHMNAFGIGVPRPGPQSQQPQQQQQGFPSTSATYTDWTQMDPAIMSTSVSNYSSKNLMQQQQQQQNLMNQQQQELFARFSQLNMSQPNGVTKLLQNGQQLPMLSSLQGRTLGAGSGGPQLLNGQTQYGSAQKMGWALPQYGNIPLPPGFAPAKPQQHPAEIIDAK